MSVGLKREVAGIVENDFGIRIIAAKRFRSRRKKERIILAPHRQRRSDDLRKNS